eukprot:915161-Pyramimonas_sp.AAC.1
MSSPRYNSAFARGTLTPKPSHPRRNLCKFVASLFGTQVNNVEVVNIDNASAGTYTVMVKAALVPMDPQAFALVVNYNGGERIIQYQTIIQ